MYNNCSTEDGTDQQCTSGPDVWDGGVNRRSYNSKKTPLVRPSCTYESRSFAQEEPFWMAAPATSPTWNKAEMEGQDTERLEKVQY